MNRPRVLIVDDHEQMLYLLRRIVESDCDVVGEAADGLAGVQAAEELKPDLIVLDVSMPLMGGFEAARLILNREPAVRIIFVTQHAEPAYVDEAFRVGGRGYVLKRSAMNELADAVRDVMEGRLFQSPAVAHCT